MRYLVGFFITIGLIILLIILLIGGGGDSKAPSTSKKLYTYATTGAEAIMTIDGPINAESEHDKVRITVSNNNVIYEEVNGYDNGVVEMRTFDNTTESYDSFLHALYHAGYSLGDKSKELADEKGYCPLGSRYIFEFKQDGKSLQRYWATQCGKPKTYKGNLGTTLELFKAQVPDYSKLTQNLDL